MNPSQIDNRADYDAGNDPSLRDEQSSVVGTDRETLLPPSNVHLTTAHEPHTTHPLTLFFFIVFPAFFGLSYYFLSNPQKISSRTHIPLTAVAPTILISIDGFRHEYLSRTRNGKPLAPTLAAFVSDGVSANKGMRPVMPSKTWPNHWSIVTGLYAESHGIIGNTMYNTDTKTWFHHDPTHPSWWNGEPIWKTLQRTRLVTLDSNDTAVESKLNYTTACVFWPGSEVNGQTPDAYWTYDRSISYDKRVQRVIDLLSGDANDIARPAQFVTAYFAGVDHTAHEEGPNSPKVDDEIARVDKAIASLLKKLGSKVETRYNIIVLADHGMTEVSEKRVVDLSAAIPNGSVQDIRTSPLGQWLNETVPAEKVHEEIKREFLKHDDHAAVFMKKNIPEEWHMRNSPLVPSVVTLAKLGWTVVYPHQQLVPGAAKRLPRDTIVHIKGDHGFDHNEADMHAIFLARGPAFRSGASVDNLDVVDLYVMLCHIFNANPAPHNGTLEKTLSTILKTG